MQHFDSTVSVIAVGRLNHRYPPPLGTLYKWMSPVAGTSAAARRGEGPRGARLVIQGKQAHIMIPNAHCSFHLGALSDGVTQRGALSPCRGVAWRAGLRSRLFKSFVLNLGGCRWLCCDGDVRCEGGKVGAFWEGRGGWIIYGAFPPRGCGSVRCG